MSAALLIFGTLMAVLAILGASGEVIAVTAVVGGGVTGLVAILTRRRNE